MTQEDKAVTVIDLIYEDGKLTYKVDGDTPKSDEITVPKNSKLWFTLEGAPYGLAIVNESPPGASQRPDDKPIVGKPTAFFEEGDRGKLDVGDPHDENTLYPISLFCFIEDENEDGYFDCERPTMLMMTTGGPRMKVAE